MKNLQFNPYQRQAGRGGTGWVGSKKFKSIPASPHSTRRKSCPSGVGKTHIGQSREGQVKRGGAKLSSLLL